MDKWRPIIFLGIAVIIGLVVSVLTYNWLQEKGKEKKVTSSETKPVAVAVSDLPWGTVFKEEMIKTAPFLSSSLPPGYFSDPSALKGRVLIFPIKANEPILESRLAPADIKTGGVAAIISPNKRAMAVKVDKVIGVSGFINPGNRVDVLVTLTASGTSLPITKTVLENMLVLATGTEVQEKEKGKAAMVDVITLEATPQEAEKMAHAASEGRLQLALRNSVDTQEVFTKGATTAALLSSYYSPTTEVKMAGERKSKILEVKPKVTVEVIKGNSVSTSTF
jgi:pilus assembly protein CpaB